MYEQPSFSRISFKLIFNMLILIEKGEKVSQLRCTVRTHRYSDCLFKHSVTNFDVYIVYQKPYVFYKLIYNNVSMPSIGFVGPEGIVTY